MSSGDESLLEAGVRGLKDALVAGRAEVAAEHRAGATGQAVCAALRELTDRVIHEAYRQALDGTRPGDRAEVEQRLALVAIGGYGRGDLAPHSDIDLLFLTAEKETPAVHTLVSRLLRDLWDIGLKVSHGVRSPTACVNLAGQDLPARTALLEPRFLVGSPALLVSLKHRMAARWPVATLGKFVRDCLAERGKEHDDYYAPTVCLLEPNVKKSPGGLRDLHLFRWVALARYHTAALTGLTERGLLSAEDAAAMEGTLELLHRIRNELHFSAGGAQDVLTRHEQVRMAAWLGFKDEGALLAVERFMQHYYRQTTALHDAALRFIERAGTRRRLRRWADRWLTRRLDGAFVLGRYHLGVDPRARETVLADGGKLLRLFELARTHKVEVAGEDVERVRAAAGSCKMDVEVRKQFLKMLGEPVRLGHLLRALQRAGLLARLVPAFEHTQCLIQFNVAHKYTIDEHSIRAIEAAASYGQRPGPVGDAYREIHRKDLLHLALLCHDLGKGLDGDHCETGRAIAEETAGLFGLSPHEREVLVFLVHRHLVMAHNAFRRDAGDEATLVQFMREVATPEALRLLYVHTAADTDAVAPGNYTAWKEALLTELYMRAMEELAGEAALSEAATRAIAGDGGQAPAMLSPAASLRRELFDALHIRFPMQWLEEQLEIMPISYLRRNTPEQIAAHLNVLGRLARGEVHVAHEYIAATGLTRLTVITHDALVPGIFSKVAGVLAAAWIEIITAQIITRPDGLLVDTFEGIDTDYDGEPPPHRSEELKTNIRDVLLGRRAVEAYFRERMSPHRPPPEPRRAPPRVEIDNDSSGRFTIVEVFASDRPRLLYDLTRTLFELGLSVSSARISTHIDQVVDAFYVSTRTGQKIAEDALEGIRGRLLGVLNAGADEGAG